MDITLVLPAYNEAAVIKETVEKAVNFFETQELSYEIIVAADGNDGTREIVSEMSESNPRLISIGNLERRGKGYGIRQAVAIAKGEIIGFNDADDKTPMTEFKTLLPWLKKGEDIVIGSRGLPDSIIEKSQPWYRRIGSKGFRVFLNLTVGLRDIYDTQCGFKFFQAKVARELFSRQRIDGYMYDVEILYIAKQMGYKIRQIPIRWRDDGDSRLNLLSGNIQNVLDILQIRWYHRKNSKAEARNEYLASIKRN